MSQTAESTLKEGTEELNCPYKQSQPFLGVAVVNIAATMQAMSEEIYGMYEDKETPARTNPRLAVSQRAAKASGLDQKISQMEKLSIVLGNTLYQLKQVEAQCQTANTAAEGLKEALTKSEPSVAAAVDVELPDGGKPVTEKKASTRKRSTKKATPKTEDKAD